MKKYVIGITATVAVLAATISPAFASTTSTNSTQTTTTSSTSTSTVQPDDWQYIW